MAGNDLVLQLQLQPRRESAGHITQADNALGFVDRKEILYPVPEAVRQDAGIFREPFRDLVVHPAAFPFQAGGQVPVIDRHPGADTMLQQAVNQLIIKRNARFIDFSRSFRKNPGPGNGKTVIPDPAVRHQGHVLPEPVIVITGSPAVGMIADRAGLFTKLIPDARGFPIFIPRAFNLKRSSRCAPDKILGKAHSGILLF